MENRDALFRNEVLEARRNRLTGELVLRPGRLAWPAVFIGAVIFLCVLLWSILFEIPRIETVPGVLEPTAPVAKLIAPQAGTVTRINIRDGEFVRRGTIIATVSTDRATGPNVSVGSASLRTIQAQEQINETRLRAEEQLAALDRTRLNQQLNTLRERERRFRSQAEIQSRIVAAAASSLEDIRPLAEKGLVTRDNLAQRSRNLLEGQKELETLRSEISETGGEIERTLIDMARAPSVEQARRSELEAARQALSRTQAGIVGAAQYAIVAPIDGFVSAVQVSPGQAIRAGLSIATVIPKELTYRAELYIPSSAIGDVRRGQSVQLRIDSFPYQKFGYVRGSITNVSQAILTPEELAAPVRPAEPTYRVSAEIRVNGFSANEQHFPFRPGMKLQGLVEVERRSVAAWLLRRS